MSSFLHILRARVAAISALSIAVALFVGLPAVNAEAGELSLSSPTLESGITSAAIESAGRVQTANLGAFNPGRIIDDALFFNGSAMTARQVQDFLDSKYQGCVAGYTCLRSYRLDTYSKPATAYCGAYSGGPYESAADVIAKVGAACGISQKVLLVTLQKEQGLVTHSAPSDLRYRKAMGQGCPDTANCDSNYYGFFNQIYGAAQQFKVYGVSQNFKYYAPGKTWNIRYSPDATCGSSPVYIHNQATANLYYYTPYQPNSAALAAGYGEGDRCSSYGNRNFYSYYTDWFGPTLGNEVGSYFLSYYASNRDWLGYTTGPMTCGGPNGGCSQAFQNGFVFSSTHSTATGVRPDVFATWSNQGREFGSLGYPIADRRCDDMGFGSCRQEFQGGWIVSSPVGGMRVVLNDVRYTWSNWGREYGALGLPLGDATCAGATCIQIFEGAWVVSNPAVGTRVVPNAVRWLWTDWGREAGILGLPVGDPSVPGGSNYVQAFQGGVVTVTNGSAGLTSSTDPWFGTVLANGWLGSGVSGKWCGMAAGACSQAFQNGWVVHSGAGAYAMPSAVVSLWSSWGREGGLLGFPTSGPSADPGSGNYTQAFQGGVVTVTNGSAGLTSSTDPWFGTVLANGWLGSGVSGKWCGMAAGACSQAFQNGWVVHSGAGAYAMPSAVVSLWSSWGREGGLLGFPTSGPSADPGSGNYTQAFQGGVVTVTNGSAGLTSSTDPWFGTVLANGWLGSGVSGKWCGMAAGACSQAFQNGWVVHSGAGAYAMPSAVVSLWSSWGREGGLLGFPTSGPSADPGSGNYTQAFQGGVVTVTNGSAGL
ncbi:LGFP repeat-containing protein [Microbacterium sp. BR1]|uniref:LGFP repeat-containing protein n=1 Tax=Microbacterium sp. BR1 TaxID=1070896 RepID=UPI000C2BCB62|nr:hypothetical protein [Microbacterium sp. BR1]